MTPIYKKGSKIKENLQVPVSQTNHSEVHICIIIVISPIDTAPNTNP